MTFLERRRVQVWFGSHVIATYVAEGVLLIGTPPR